jgi:hypothetical protein
VFPVKSRKSNLLNNRYFKSILTEDYKEFGEAFSGLLFDPDARDEWQLQTEEAARDMQA